MFYCSYLPLKRSFHTVFTVFLSFALCCFPPFFSAVTNHLFPLFCLLIQINHSLQFLSVVFSCPSPSSPWPHIMNYSVLNIYHHPNLKVVTISQETTQFFGQNPRNKNIFGGDFNWDVKEKQMEEIEKCCASLCMLCLKWDEPTHYKRRCIDHIFFLSKAPLKHLFINAILSGFNKDHALLIGGSLFKEWKIQMNKKSIPEYLINNHRFINTLIERMDTFSKGDDLNEFLTRFKTTAWELVSYWRERNTKAALFREL